MPFQTPAIVQPSPTLRQTQSGIMSAHCSAISSPHVFLPSTRYELIAQLRLYQPYFAHASMQKSYATSYVPFTLITVAPNTSSCAIFGSGAFSGTKINAGKPTAAAKHASEEAALPVEAQAIVFAWNSVAFITPTELARSLNDALGLRPSSLR